MGKCILQRWKSFRTMKKKRCAKKENVDMDGNLLTFRQLYHKYYIPKKHSAFQNISITYLSRHFLWKPHGKYHSSPSKWEEADFIFSYILNVVEERIEAKEWETADLEAEKQSIEMRVRLLEYEWLMRTYTYIMTVKRNHWSPDILDKL